MGDVRSFIIPTKFKGIKNMNKIRKTDMKFHYLDNVEGSIEEVIKFLQDKANEGWERMILAAIINTYIFLEQD